MTSALRAVAALRATGKASSRRRGHTVTRLVARWQSRVTRSRRLAAQARSRSAIGRATANRPADRRYRRSSLTEAGLSFADVRRPGDELAPAVGTVGIRSASRTSSDVERRRISGRNRPPRKRRSVRRSAMDRAVSQHPGGRSRSSRRPMPVMFGAEIRERPSSCRGWWLSAQLDVRTAALRFLNRRALAGTASELSTVMPSGHGSPARRRVCRRAGAVIRLRREQGGADPAFVARRA